MKYEEYVENINKINEELDALAIKSEYEYVKNLVKALSDKKGLPGGKHKAFDKSTGTVIPKTASGLADADREENCAKALKDYNDDNLFSFQSQVDETIFNDIKKSLGGEARNLKHPSRVSMYKFDKCNINMLGYKQETASLFDFITYMKGLEKSATHGSALEISEQMIHQIIYIHEMLYRAKVKHGDAHLNNYKVIATSLGPKIKLFDFGKAEVDVTESNRYKDLKYLCSREAVSGSHETYWRRVKGLWSESNKKHFPLHRIIQAHKGKSKYGDYSADIEAAGNTAISALKSNYKTNKNTTNDAVRDIFATLSDEIVNILK
ncbi:hypothetical protein [Vibrio spartinae]|uniref:Protein kinase domain-containing protein n=1 Tax=Vibrio spartinae TaxID=1918945 RepID=A0A1N6M3F6_9VIBR|nr:hypothetical protein [Vibrio spartinae]SIO93972.1 hypothetical protein VSP9026_01653 [Vibrio spartinae]